jgi:hypothetical protein
MQRENNGEGPYLVSEKTSVPARSLRGADLSRVWLWNRLKLQSAIGKVEPVSDPTPIIEKRMMLSPNCHTLTDHALCTAA